MNEANTALVSPLPEYASSCSSGKRSKGGSPSSNSRQRESTSTSPLSIQRVFTLLNDLRSLRHSVRSTSDLKPSLTVTQSVRFTRQLHAVCPHPWARFCTIKPFGRFDDVFKYSLIPLTALARPPHGTGAGPLRFQRIPIPV